MKRLLYISMIFTLAACQENAPQAPEPINNPQAQILVQSCSGCHRAGNEAIPDISTLTKSEMLKSLRNYRKNKEGNSVMHRLMRGYDEAQMDQIAEILGTQE